jgi:hypothetical protein
LIEEKQCRESLILRGSGDAFLHGEMGEKVGDFFLAHFVWMAFAMKENVTPDPIDIRLFGADAVMFHPQVPSDAVE